MKKLLLLSVFAVLSLWSMVSLVQSQCPITDTSIRIDSDSLQLTDRDSLVVILEGITTGAQATSVTWRRNGDIVNRNTPVPGVGSFFDGGGQAIVGSGPCESQMYRVALQVTGLLPGNYTYTVTNANTPIPVASPVLQLQDPDPPTNIVLSQISNRRVQATWTAPAGFPNATYRVFLNTANVNTGGTAVTDGATYTTSILATDFTVTLRIRATTGTYLSVPAVSETISIRDVLVPMITLSSVTATSATLSLSQPTNSLPVDMYTATLTSTTCTGVSTRTGSSTSNSVTIGSLEAGIQYSVSVTGRNNLAELTGTGTTTLTTSETAPSGSPGAPTSTAITSTSITITWTEIACLDRNGVITGYTIGYGPVNTPPTTIDHNNVNMRSRQITGLIPFTLYTISVRGVNSAGPGGYSGETVIRTAEGRPASVTGLSGTPMLFSVVLTWSEPVPLNGILNTYTIRYSVNGSSEVTHTTSATTFTITDLNPNTVVSNIRVRAATGAGDGPYATSADITTLSGPAEVQKVKVEGLSTTAVRVSWDNTDSQDITDFVVYYRETGCRMGQAQEMSVVVPASANSVIINNLIYGAQYVFEVVPRVTRGDKSITGPRAGLGEPLVLTTQPSQHSIQANNGQYIAITAVVAVIVTVIVYSLVLIAILLALRCSSKKDTKSSDVEMEACPAYGQAPGKENSSHYESVKSQEAIYSN